MRKLKKPVSLPQKSIYITLIGISLLFLSNSFLLTAYASEKVVRWRMQDIWGPESIYHKANQKLVSRIKMMTKGRLDITLFPSGSIVPPKSTFDAIKKNLIQGHISAPAYWAGKIPACAVLMSVPGGIDSAHDFNTWYWEFGGIELAREAYQSQGLHFVGPGIIGENAQFIKKQHPINSIADFKGLKIRTIPGVQSELMSALGAAPVFLPLPEVYTALETGVLDAVSGFTISGWRDFGIHEVTHWIVKPGFVQPATALEVVVSTKAWDKLSTDIKIMLESAVREWSQYWFASDHLENQKALNEMMEKGLQVVRLKDSELENLRKTAHPIVDKWVSKDPMAQKVWDSQKEYLKLMGKIK